MSSRYRLKKCMSFKTKDVCFGYFLLILKFNLTTMFDWLYSKFTNKLQLDNKSTEKLFIFKKTKSINIKMMKKIKKVKNYFDRKLNRMHWSSFAVIGIQLGVELLKLESNSVLHQKKYNIEYQNLSHLWILTLWKNSF